MFSLFGRVRAIAKHTTLQMFNLCFTEKSSKFFIILKTFDHFSILIASSSSYTI